MSLTAEIASLVAGQHGCGDPCRQCMAVTSRIKQRIALAVHIQRMDVGRVDLYYAGIIRARNTILDGESLT